MAPIYGFDANHQGGRIGLEPKDTFIRSCKEGICDQRIGVLPLFLPLLKRLAGKTDRPAARIPIDVVVHTVLIAGPIGAKKSSLFEIDDVVIEREGEVIFHPRSNHLTLLREGEKTLVSYMVSLTIVLVKAAGFCSIDDIVGYKDVRTALIGIDAPAAIIEGVNIVYHVVILFGATVEIAKRIDASHITENALANILNTVVV